MGHGNASGAKLCADMNIVMDTGYKRYCKCQETLYSDDRMMCLRTSGHQPGGRTAHDPAGMQNGQPQPYGYGTRAASRFSEGFNQYRRKK